MERKTHKPQSKDIQYTRIVARRCIHRGNQLPFRGSQVLDPSSFVYSRLYERVVPEMTIDLDIEENLQIRS